MRAAKADFWSGLALGGLGVYIIAQAWQWEYLGNDGPGPGFFPVWYGIAMAGLSLALMVSSVRSADAETIDWSGAGRAFATWAALAVAVALLGVAGVMYRRPLWVGAVTAVLAAAVFYAVFALALGVKLP